MSRLPCRASLTELLEAEAELGSRSARLADRARTVLAGDLSHSFALLVRSGGFVAVVSNGAVTVRDAEFVRLRGEAPGELLRADLLFEETLVVVGDAGGGLRLSADPETAEVAARPATSEEIEPRPDAPVVDGLECVRGHLNRPSARYCGVCGIGMVQQSRPARGPRPPLGVLMLDHGTRPLDGDYVIGSAPASHEAVRTGRARALRLADPERQVAPTHALVVLNGWTVEIHDLGSPAGTRLCEPGSSHWQQLPANGSAVLEPGGRLGIGGATIEYRVLNSLSG